MARAAADLQDGALWAPEVRARLMSRLAMGLLLDMIEISRQGGSVLDALLMGATIQANVQEIIRRADLQLAYAREDELPPDEVRRPVSMNALAASLQLPFETVRRRIRKLAADDYVRIVEGGVIVPSEVLTNPQYYVDGLRAFERLRAFYAQGRALGLLNPLPQPTVGLGDGAMPVRAVARLMGVYVLRAAETLPPLGDLTDGVVWMETYWANVEHLPAEPQSLDTAGADDLAGDGQRRPVPVTTLAARLGLPQETVRRHVTELIARGQLTRVKGGLIAPADALARPEVAAVLNANAANLQRLFAALSQLGVLQIWDGLAPPGSGAASAPGSTPARSIPQNG